MNPLRIDIALASVCRQNARCRSRDEGAPGAYQRAGAPVLGSQCLRPRRAREPELCVADRPESRGSQGVFLTSKRRALIEEVGALQEGIATALQQFRTGSD